MRALVTGGYGFIGSCLVRTLLKNKDNFVLNIDCMTYAADRANLSTVEKNSNYRHENIDICEQVKIQKIVSEFQPDVIFHLAAESHVDRSIDAADDFISTNINGTHSLLEVMRHYWQGSDKRETLKFIHVSTDEVYGSLDKEEAPFDNDTPYAPNSPYSASKAASDHLARAWHKTYGLPIIITHCSNNYGPHQNIEKLIPNTINCVMSNKNVPIYGNGENIRDWIHVQDHVDGLISVYNQEKIGETYNFGGDTEISNINIVRKILSLLDEKKPSQTGASYVDLIEFVTDRAGHDFRYAIDNQHVIKELNWKPIVDFDIGLKQTIDYYIEYLAKGN